GLARLDGYIGINNHMGSRFTQDRAGMSVVMAEVKSRGLLFLDSVTIGRTVGAATAQPLHVPFAERNVFLDDEATIAGVTRQIAVLEQVARKHGTAIAIGHPHAATIDVLAQWLPKAASRGIAVVPLTSVVRRQALV
ncbi:MAG TPA: divergent polysaccharide deacetylase family protein, partial [Casimicrobiaceae bacterium]|nr:divergent polysaccharide deacetylase family protein [Casimicrobiaceae bacterium]